MSPLYVFNQKLLVSDGALATSKACCCGSSSSSSSSSSDYYYQQDPSIGCGNCYRLQFNWFIVDCGGNTLTIAGTLLMDNTGIKCYDIVGANVLSANATNINFENPCGGQDAFFAIYCGSSTTAYGYMDLGPSSYTNAYAFLPVNLCCIDSGEYQLNDNNNQASVINIAMYPHANGSCDCSGYTAV